MSKYEPLPQFLSSKTGAVHRMSFEQIERILGFKLPKSAYEHEAWWSNNEHRPFSCPRLAIGGMADAGRRSRRAQGHLPA